MDSSGIVNILSVDGKSFGTGFFVSPNGYILTCKHVLQKAGYRRTGETVVFKYADHAARHQARWIESSKDADLAVLCANTVPPSYIPMCDRDVSGGPAECYGFPNGSYMDMKAVVLVERFFDRENRIQLGKANTVTLGFSGGPVLYNGAAIGIVEGISKLDSYGRMSQAAFAISARSALKLFPQYISKEDLCIGYGENEKKCENYVATKDAATKALGLCEKCFAQKFSDDVKALYKTQNYRIHEVGNFFVTELQYGASKYFDAVFTLVKFGDTIKRDELFPLPFLVQSSGYDITQTVIVTNARLDEDCSEIIKAEKLAVKTREELLRGLFDFEPYRRDLFRRVHSEQLSTHYIEVYGTAGLPKDGDSGAFHKDSDEDDDDLYSEYEYSEEWYEEDELWEENEEIDVDEDQEHGGHNSNQTGGLLLKDYVAAFLESKHQALLILGDYGCGKTSFCYTYALELLNRFFQDRSACFPLLIKLRGYNKAVGIGQILTDYFVNDLGISNFNLGAFKLLLKNINTVLIFDGYDEVAKKVDFDIKYEVLKEICSLAESRTKVIVTCRPNYFQNASEFQEIFQNSHFQYEPGDKPLMEFIENSIADLNESQIDAYIDSYQNELTESNITKEELIQTIANTHDLSDLAKRPFLLYMIMCTLPKILKETKGKKTAKINSSKLYQVYTENWLRREDRKNKTLIKRADKELFCKELAFELYTSNAVSLSYRELPETIKRNFQHVDRAEDIDYFSHDIQSCSFLTSDRSGEFKFIHKSFMEYFVADRVVSKLVESFSKNGRIDKKGKEANKILEGPRLSMEICLFISDILSSMNRDLVGELAELFNYLSDTATANLLSILSKTGLNMSEYFLPHLLSAALPDHVDFGYAKFKDGVIKNLSFQDAQFYSASLEGITFINCDFRGAVFYKSALKNVKFYRCQFTCSKWRESKLSGCQFSNFYSEIRKGPEIWELTDYMKQSFGQCSFEKTSWRNSTINSCSFYKCALVDNYMDVMRICNSTFKFVDFSGTHIFGYSTFRNNKMYHVLGEPYEF